MMLSKEAILELLAIAPCHVTGMHEPEHHLKYTCNLQLREAVERLLGALNVEVADLPRRLHDEDCGWCHRVPSQEKHRESFRKTHEWAGVEVPSELAEV